MDRRGLAEFMVENGCGCTPSYAEHWIALVAKAIEDAVCLGERVKLRGFGSFYQVERKGKRVVTRGGQEIFSPDHIGIRYVPGKQFAQRVRQQDSDSQERKE